MRMAIEALNGGGVIVCPTDTVHAFACSAHSASAIAELVRIKGVRPGKAGLSLVCNDLRQLSRYTRHVDTVAFRVMKRALPGPYTFILEASSEIPKLFKNNRRTVGIRVPDHAVPRAIVEELGGALAVTSVHDPDEISVYTAEPHVIEERHGNRLAMVIDAGPCGLEPSTVIDLTTSVPEVIRAGKGDLGVLG